MTAGRRSWEWTKYRILVVIIVVVGVVAYVAGASFSSVVVAGLLAYAVFWVGWAALGAFARPVPAPPPPGELRPVRLHYRCSNCGAEMRMTAAADDDPEPPRHCLEDMDLVAPTFE
jgi:hypothetical protein